MGSGKTSAAINYMNDNASRRFIYVTPYLDEVVRIKAGCPALGFLEPVACKTTHYHKSESLAQLIEAGENIATTHQAFSRLSPASLRMVSRREYTLIVDEDIEMLDCVSVKPADVEDAVRLGYVTRCGNVYMRSPEKYSGGVFSGVLDLLGRGEMFGYNAGSGEAFFWTLPDTLISSFDTAIIMTYMFEGQILCQYLRHSGIRFDYIGVGKDASGRLVFSHDREACRPDPRLKNLIDILDRPKLNAVGDSRTALSANWFLKNSASSEPISRLRNNISNVFKNIYRCDKSRRLCGTSAVGAKKISSNGFSTSIIAFNTKATNKYSSCDCLVYAMNVFLNPNMTLFMRDHGLFVDEDVYALSVMLQWIWRSAIRNGHPIRIYIPSRRMRELLVEWLDTVSSGVDFIEAHRARRKRA